MKTYDEILESTIERNDDLIYNFAKWLKKSGLSEETIRKHINNISFFLNHYLVYQEIDGDIDDDAETIVCQAEDGVDFIDDFLGYWFIRKAMWSDERSIKSNITSIKKFYTFMQSLNLISKDDLKFLKEEIKENKDEWIDTVNRYNNIDEDFDWD